MRGCITKRGRHSWRIKIDAEPDATGKRRFHTVTVRGTRKDAETELAKLITDASKGTLVAPTKLTVGEHLHKWLDGKSGLTPLSRQGYTVIIDRQIAPVLGAFELQKLKPADVKMWLTAMRTGRRGGQLAPRTIIHAYRVLRAAIQEALRHDLVSRNVVDCVEPPRPEKREVAILKADEIPAVLEALKGNRRIYPIVALALATGARRSELLALKWANVDLKGGTLRIERSIEQTRAGLRFKSPKTESGKRTVMLPAFALDMLNEHRKAQLELRLQLGMGKPDSEALVFCTHKDTPISPNAFSVMWHRVVRQAGLPPRSFHSLRHSHASALIRAGLDVVRVSRQLGHSSPNITLGTYAHEFREVDSGAADAINKVLG
jgi:integrase